jgi:two-component system LytT family response regulator
MLKVLIIDDEQNTREVISIILKKHCPELEIIGYGDSVQTGIQAIENLEPDLVLLDINLPDGDGFDILKHFERPEFKVVFITAYENYALKAFKFSAVDYILKPVNSAELVETVKKIAAQYQATSALEIHTLNRNFENKNKESKKIILKTQDSIYAVNVTDIIRCESDTYYTKFFLNDGEMVMVSSTLKNYDEMLSEYGFFRIHQSHLINMDYFVKFKKTDGGFAILKDGSEVPVAMRKKELFLQTIENS